MHTFHATKYGIVGIKLWCVHERTDVRDIGSRRLPISPGSSSRIKGILYNIPLTYIILGSHLDCQGTKHVISCYWDLYMHTHTHTHLISSWIQSYIYSTYAYTYTYIPSTTCQKTTPSWPACVPRRSSDFIWLTDLLGHVQTYISYIHQ